MAAPVSDALNLYSGDSLYRRLSLRQLPLGLETILTPEDFLKIGDVIFVSLKQGSLHTAWTYTASNKTVSKAPLENEGLLKRGRPLGVITAIDRTFYPLYSVRFSGVMRVNNVWDNPKNGDVVGYVIQNNNIVPWIFKEGEAADYSHPMRVAVVVDSDGDASVLLKWTVFDFASDDAEMQQEHLDAALDAPSGCDVMPGGTAVLVKAASKAET